MIIKKAVIEKANRLYQLPPDIFSFTREKSKPTRLKKMDLLDLARFNWPVEVESGSVAVKDMLTPAASQKIASLKETLAEWCSANFGVKLNPAKEIFVGGRLSNLLLLTALAFVDNGDIVFVPEVGLPLYKRVTTACGGEPVHYSVSAKNDWRPDFERINTRLGRVARLLFLNSPHNPTGVSLAEKEIENLVWMASRENIVIVNDAAYFSISSRTPASLLSVPGGKKVGVEVHSFSYLFGLPPLPFGFVIGNREVVSGLEMASRLMPMVLPTAYIDLALSMIRQYPGQGLLKVRERIQSSTAEATKLLSEMSLRKASHDTIPFMWAEISGRRHARTMASRLYRRSRILVAPGTALGDNAEGFLRLSLTALPETYQAARDRVRKRLNILKSGEES